MQILPVIELKRQKVFRNSRVVFSFARIERAKNLK